MNGLMRVDDREMLVVSSCTVLVLLALVQVEKRRLEEGEY